MKPKDVLKHLSDDDNAVLRFVGQLRIEERALKENIVTGIKKLDAVNIDIEQAEKELKDAKDKAKESRESYSRDLSGKINFIKEKEENPLIKKEFEAKDRMLNERENKASNEDQRLEEYVHTLNSISLRHSQMEDELSKRESKVRAREEETSKLKKSLRRREALLETEKNKVKTQIEDVKKREEIIIISQEDIEVSRKNIVHAETNVFEKHKDIDEKLTKANVTQRSLDSEKESLDKEKSESDKYAKSLSGLAESLEQRQESIKIGELELQIRINRFEKQKKIEQLESVINN